MEYYKNETDDFEVPNTLDKNGLEFPVMDEDGNLIKI